MKILVNAEVSGLLCAEVEANTIEEARKRAIIEFLDKNLNNMNNINVYPINAQVGGREFEF